MRYTLYSHSVLLMAFSSIPTSLQLKDSHWPVLLKQTQFCRNIGNAANSCQISHLEFFRKHISKSSHKFIPFCFSLRNLNFIVLTCNQYKTVINMLHSFFIKAFCVFSISILTQISCIRSTHGLQRLACLLFQMLRSLFPSKISPMN